MELRGELTSGETVVDLFGYWRGSGNNKSKGEEEEWGREGRNCLVAEWVDVCMHSSSSFFTFAFFSLSFLAPSLVFESVRTDRIVNSTLQRGFCGKRLFNGRVITRRSILIHAGLIDGSESHFGEWPQSGISTINR